MREREAYELAKRMFLLQKQSTIDSQIVNELANDNLFRDLNRLKL